MLAITDGQRGAPGDVATVNRALCAALAHLRSVPAGSAYVWDWAEAAHMLDRMLWPVVRSAAELLTATELHRAQMRGCRMWLDLPECQ